MNYTTKADKTISAPPVRYSDFTDNLDAHPDTGDLFRYTNDNAIRRSLRNIIMTDKYERAYEPDFGCNIRAYLFENITSSTLTLIKDTIQTAIVKYEPRVKLQNITVTGVNDMNSVSITIEYSIINIANSVQTLTTIFNRVR